MQSAIRAVRSGRDRNVPRVAERFGVSRQGLNKALRQTTANAAQRVRWLVRRGRSSIPRRGPTARQPCQRLFPRANRLIAKSGGTPDMKSRLRLAAGPRKLD